MITTGGVFFAELMGTIEVWDSIFTSNSANQGGGAFYVLTYSTITIYNCSVSLSSTFGKGGAVQVQAYATFISHQSVFTRNEAAIGGALHAEFNAHLYLYDTKISSNVARYLGVSTPEMFSDTFLTRRAYL